MSLAHVTWQIYLCLYNLILTGSTLRCQHCAVGTFYALTLCLYKAVLQHHGVLVTVLRMKQGMHVESGMQC